MKIAIQFSDHDDYDVMVKRVVEAIDNLLADQHEYAATYVTKMLRAFLEGEIVEA
jgi:hypothetical protein